MASQTSIFQNCMHIYLKRNKKFQSLFIIFYLEHLKSSKILIFFLGLIQFENIKFDCDYEHTAHKSTWFINKGLCFIDF